MKTCVLVGSLKMSVQKKVEIIRRGQSEIWPEFLGFEKFPDLVNLKSISKQTNNLDQLAHQKEFGGL